MPIIKARANRVRTVRHICRLQEPNRDDLLSYVRSIEDTAGDAVNQLIETTIAKGREFVAWRPRGSTVFQRRPDFGPARRQPGGDGPHRN